MRTRSDRRSRRRPSSHRGFTLLAVSLIGILIAAAAAALLVVAREGARSAFDDDKNAAAWSAAMAGLTWAQLHLDDNAGKAALQAAADGTASAVKGLTIHVFNANDRFAGVGAPPPAVGTSNTAWKANEGGHFALLGADDALATNGVLVRSVGRVGGAQVVLETNLNVNVLKSLPGAFTGCFGSSVNITYYDEQSPGDYQANVRFDGNGGVPIGLSADHDRLNGLARTSTTGTAFADTGTQDPVVGYPTGKRWRGAQSLRTEPLAAAIPGTGRPAAPTNRFGGTPAGNSFSDNVGNLSGWDANPYMANDPRLVGAAGTTTTTGLGMNTDGAVDGAADGTQRGLPLIGYFATPLAVPAGAAFLGESDWAPAGRDDSARKGFYGCANHPDDGNGTADDSLHEAARSCLTGRSPAGVTDWRHKALNHAGRAWGLLSSVLRQCTGSGDSIDPTNGQPWFHATNNPNGIQCSPAFAYLENVAACFIAPLGVGRGTNANRPVTGSAADDADKLANDFRGCHPGCLLAGDFDGDGDADQPYRSVCINLDPQTATTYGPDIASAIGVAPELPYIRNWLKYANSQYSSRFTVPADTDPPTAINTATVTAPAGDAVPADAAVFAEVAPFLEADGKPRLLSRPGFVTERGNPSLITRFDLTDRGPLGTCEQNCLAYGFGRDVTYGEHRTEAALGGRRGSSSAPQSCSAKVPKEPDGFADVHCNLDYDRDGRLDRKSYAIATSFREECADPHDGVAWAPAVNISNTNPAIGGDGCLNTMPNDAATATPQRLTPFCSAGSLNEIQDSVDGLLAIATTADPVKLAEKTKLVDGGNWFGGARCHVGNLPTFEGRTAPAGLHPHTGNLAGVDNDDVDVFGHPDYWIEDTCPDPQIVKVTSTLAPGVVCGCGVLVIDDVRLSFGSGSHLLWRGLVVWNMRSITGDVWAASGDGFASFIVEGGFLATGERDFTITIAKKDSEASVITRNDTRGHKMFFRMNPNAIQESLTGQQKALRSVRRIQ
jgi:hypothetical protein